MRPCPPDLPQLNAYALTSLPPTADASPTSPSGPSKAGPCSRCTDTSGAINGYHLAAGQPGAVSALINIDGPAYLPPVDPAPLSFLLDLPYTAPTREELLAACGPLTPLLEGGMRPHRDGWRLGCHPKDMVDSDTRVLGDHWRQWLGTGCPALLLHGTASNVLPTAQAHEMASRRPGTTLVELDADHWVHLRRPEESAAAIRRFLDTWS
ncbi:alpha/beta fold hydrolase [Streptomyces sp. NPDC093589]|uniref:alpha/beta fold hydrolase n=1 Tax=Streptomyces sp. NPDC093589 TaxID=3366043 RepID=UPI0037F30926